MLSLLHISQIALIDELRVEFDSGLNLLTGETGSGKSIIVDALGVLLGGKFTSDLLKSGADRGWIEALFTIRLHPELAQVLSSAGILSNEETDADSELIIRRELTVNGKSKTFVNNHLATQSLLRELRPFLVDIHGQGDQQTLFDSKTHLALLDGFMDVAARSNTEKLRTNVADSYRRWDAARREIAQLTADEAEKLQLVDLLKFQIGELQSAGLSPDEDVQLEEERRRLANVEKLTQLSLETYKLIYEDDGAALSRLREATKRVDELAEFDGRFRSYREGLDSAHALLEDLAFSLRDFADKLEFSPARQSEIEERLVELSRLKRKYGGTIEAALEHLARSEDRLRSVEHSDERTAELQKASAEARTVFLSQANELHSMRVKAAKKFEQTVEHNLTEVAMANARFQVQIAKAGEENDDLFSEDGLDGVEFYFSANPGEEVKPLARVASGGEASRLMLVLKTVANPTQFPRTIVFDEVDAGIGGRVSDAVGAKLKRLGDSNQVLCVTHQPQIARFADSHLVVSKETARGRTRVRIEKLDRKGQVEELARMLTGAEITESARRHAKELLKF